LRANEEEGPNQKGLKNRSGVRKGITRTNKTVNEAKGVPRLRRRKTQASLTARFFEACRGSRHTRKLEKTSWQPSKGTRKKGLKKVGKQQKKWGGD